MSFLNLAEDVGDIKHQPLQGTDGRAHMAMFRWDTDLLDWVMFTGEGSGGPSSDVNVLNFPSSFGATQATHDNLNLNANLQVGDTDVSAGNPVPFSAASLPLPTGAATQTTLAALLTELQLKADLSETQPVSAASLPLPTGAATAANQLPDNHQVTVSNFPATQTVSGSVSVSNFPATQAISAASLPLPTGAATQTTLAALLTELQLKADLSETQPVSAASLPLPTGAATSALQTTGNTALSAIQTAVQIMDDWDESDRAKVNPIVGQAGVAAGSGASSANTQRVILATDSPVPTASQTATTVSESSVSVTGSSTSLAALNSSRKRLTIQNHGTGFVRVSFSGTATLTSPLRLVPAVGAWVIEGDFLHRGAVSAISESGTNEVGVIEET